MHIRDDGFIGAGILLGRGVLNLQKVKKITAPTTTDTHYDCIEISIEINKINAIPIWSSCDSLKFGHQNFYDHIFFLLFFPFL